MWDKPNGPFFRAAYNGYGLAPTVAAGNAAQLGTGPTAAAAGTIPGAILTLTTGTTPSAFVANTPVTIATITLPAGLFQAAPSNVSIDAANQAVAQVMCGTNGLTFFYDVGSSSATSIVIKAVATGTPTLTGSTAYKLSIGVMG